MLYLRGGKKKENKKYRYLHLENETQEKETRKQSNHWKLCKPYTGNYTQWLVKSKGISDITM